MNRNDTGDVMTHLPITTPPGGINTGLAPGGTARGLAECRQTGQHRAWRGKPLLLAVVLGLTAFATVPAQAATVQFSRIASGDQGLQQFWQFTPDEVQRYRNIMAATGDRYKNASPLMVLSMMADGKEDRDYYARKAAEMEHALVMREIETAWLVSEHMSEARLTEQMTLLTDGLTGLDTARKQAEDNVWQEGDELVLYVDGSCLTAGCISQFNNRMRSAPDNIPRRLIVRAQEPLSSAAQTIVESWPETGIQRFDAVEHGRFLNVRNQAPNAVLHIRDRTIVEVLSEQTPSAAIPAVAPTTPATARTQTIMPADTAATTGSHESDSKPAQAVDRSSTTAQPATSSSTAPEKKATAKPATDNKSAKKGDKS